MPRWWPAIDLGLVALALPLGAQAATTLDIDPETESCRPVSAAFATCAQACEADAMGCAEDIQDHISRPGFMARRQLYPTTAAREPNPITPMHGLFNTIYVNARAKSAIEAALAQPFDPVDLPAWSIVAKENENPIDNAGTLETWQTTMYKIGGTMHSFSRRGFLSTAGVAPLAPGLLLPAATAGEVQAAQPLPEVWAAGARPDFVLSVERHEMAPFGTPIETLLAGGTWPGKTIRYRKGDQLRVLVENRLEVPTSLHWHGLIVPSLEDGVPVVSQAPILPGAALYYAFPLQQAGTYWYHSHFGLQEQQGLSGPLIIEDPAEPHDYDEDLVVALSDVVAGPVERVIPGLRDGSLQMKVAEPYRMPDGAPFPTDVPYAGYLLNGQPPADPWTQALRPGSRTRLRLINASGSSYFRIALGGVPLEVIARDGEAVVPVTVDDLVLGTAERCDVIVSLPASGSYPLRAAALGDDKQALGVLHTPDVRPQADDRRATFPGRTLQVADLRAPSSTALPDAPQQTFEVELSGDMKGYRWLMNGNLWPEPYAPHAGEGAEESWYQVRPGDRLRFDLINQTPMAHPMHLHGHVFRVLENGQDRADAPLMDTVTVWPKSRLSIELLANNPGRWFFHCHNVWHLAAGMAQAVSYQVTA